jgi:hypothetical protein
MLLIAARTGATQVKTQAARKIDEVSPSYISPIVGACRSRLFRCVEFALLETLSTTQRQPVSFAHRFTCESGLGSEQAKVFRHPFRGGYF